MTAPPNPIEAEGRRERVGRTPNSTPSPGGRGAVSAFSLLLLTLAWLLLASLLQNFDAVLHTYSDQAKLDLRPHYSAEDVQSLFAAYGPEGRQRYAELSALDMLFAITVGVWGSRIARVTPRPERWPLRRVLGAASYAFMLLDVAENTLLLWLLRAYPAAPVGLVTLCSLITLMKLLALVVTYGGALRAGAHLALAVLRGTTSPLRLTALTRNQIRGLSLVGVTFTAGLTVIQSVIWNGPSAPSWMTSLLPEALTLVPELDYDRFGRLFAGAPLLLLALVHDRVSTTTPVQRWAARLLLITLGADVCTYWIFGWHQPAMRAFAFWGVEVPAWLGYGVLGLWQGGVALRDARRRRLAGAPPSIPSAAVAGLALLPLMVLNVALFRYMPHAFALPALALAPWLGGSRRGTPA